MMLGRSIAGLALAMAIAAPLQAADTAAVPDLSGFWSRTTFGMEPPASGQGPIQPVNRRRADGSRVDNPQFNVGDENSPILKPAAAAAVRKRNEMQRAGVDTPTPSNQCTPMIAPYAFRVQGMQVLQRKDEVIFLYMQDHQVRHVRLNAQHPAKPAPTYSGDSIAHFEGDTLVVDTVGFKVGRVAQIDQYGSPYSEQLHVVERYRLIDYEVARAAQERNVRANGGVATEQAAAIDPDYKGKGLQVQFTVEDKNYFTMAWGGAATYRKAGSEWVENVCAENTHEYYNNGSTKVPEAERPDF
jgi:hypothetical protein